MAYTELIVIQFKKTGTQQSNIQLKYPTGTYFDFDIDELDSKLELCKLYIEYDLLDEIKYQLLTKKHYLHRIKVGDDIIDSHIILKT